MAMYQFLIAVRFGPGAGQASSMLMNESGEVTSHIQGMFNRTIKLMTSGIRPVYVFDGKPPNLKGGELAKRLARRAKAEADLAEAKIAESAEDVDRFSRRLVKVTRQHNEDCKELLRLMGVPVINAPCEAEAQCAELAKKHKVYGTATEDMDALTFKSPKLIRKLTFSQSNAKEKQAILEIDYEMVLKGLDLTYDQFVDLCILCGCDYCSTIKGIGPKTALKLIKQYKTLESVVAVLKKDKKYSIPVDWFPQRVRRDGQDEEKPEAVKKEDSNESTGETNAESSEKPEVDAEGEDNNIDNIEYNDDGNIDSIGADVTAEASNEPEAELVEDETYEVVKPLYAQARELFVNCEVELAENIDLKWNEPDEAGLKDFLVDRMGFNPERVMNAVKKLKEAQQKKSQQRMDR
jgi:flap endonuclease-1